MCRVAVHFHCTIQCLLISRNTRIYANRESSVFSRSAFQGLLLQPSSGRSLAFIIIADATPLLHGRERERTELFVCVPSSSIGHRGSTRHTGLWRLGSLPGWPTSRVVYGSFLSRFSWPFFISALSCSGGGTAVVVIFNCRLARASFLMCAC